MTRCQHCHVVQGSHLVNCPDYREPAETMNVEGREVEITIAIEAELIDGQVYYHGGSIMDRVGAATKEALLAADAQERQAENDEREEYK